MTAPKVSAPEPTARPAFTTRRGMVAFTLLLAVVLLLPLMARLWGPGPRRDAYLSVPTRAGPFLHHYREIYEKDGAIDVLVLGSSILWAAIDTPQLEEELSLQLGRPAVARSLGFCWEGPDLQYVFLKDLLERRRVGLVVLMAPKPWWTRNAPHPMLPRLVRPGEEKRYGLGGLSWVSRAQIWGGQMLCAPRQLWSRMRRDRADLAASDPFREFHEGIDAKGGALLRERGFGGADYERVEVPSPRLESADLVHDPDHVDFGPPLTPYKAHFYGLIGELCVEHEVAIALVDIPDYGQERDRERSRFPEGWPELFGGRVWLIGAPGARLFRDLAPDDRRRLYYDYHLNANGSRWFTGTIAPGISEVFRRANRPS